MYDNNDNMIKLTAMSLISLSNVISAIICYFEKNISMQKYFNLKLKFNMN